MLLVPCSASHFGRAIVMPNLKPPVTTTAAALAYQESILKALPPNSNFTPLMTLYLTDSTSPDEIKLASKSNWNMKMKKPVGYFIFGRYMPLFFSFKCISLEV